jgi:hypothetical protein
MYKHVALIFPLLITAAAADDYRSFKEAYAGVPWPKSMTSIEQCQNQVADTVRQFDFTDAVGIDLLVYAGNGQPVPSGVPLPAALPLFAAGLGALGLLSWRSKRKA